MVGNLADVNCGWKNIKYLSSHYPAPLPKKLKYILSLLLVGFLGVYVYILQEKLKHHLALLILYDSDTKILSHHLQTYHSDKVVEQIFFDYKGTMVIPKSLKKTHMVVTCNIIPKIKNSTPPVSLIDAPCSLDQKSGNLIKPKLPVKSKNDPKSIKIQLHISINKLNGLSFYSKLFCHQFLYI